MSELDEALKEEKLIIGRDRTLKLLKNDKLKKIFIASNCDEDVREEIKKYAKISKVEVIELKIDNIELGAMCKKPFAISVLSY
ncbi:unnamed protein product [marine sediment metagenome]|uniref:Ribosomal protein eL8/eL30/eS12/Gadd45 domain-containing protein n=1 Tax=marine sediment metagenome TaxID=412755 RepID=X0VNB4_9ZZZZ